MQELLEKVKEFAENAHGYQKRKYSTDPYIVHPVRVMEMCKNFTDDNAVLAAALLHDVLEDTPVTKKEMNEFLEKNMEKEIAERTVLYVEELTDVYIKKDYPRLNRKKRKAKEAFRIEKTSAESQTIKYADIIDNTSEIVTHDPEFARVFLKECKSLLTQMKKGNKDLYEKAVAKVEESLQQLRIANS